MEQQPRCETCKHLITVSSAIQHDQYVEYYKCDKMGVSWKENPMPVNLYCWESIHEVEQPEIDSDDILSDPFFSSID